MIIIILPSDFSELLGYFDGYKSHLVEFESVGRLLLLFNYSPYHPCRRTRRLSSYHTVLRDPLTYSDGLVFPLQSVLQYLFTLKIFEALGMPHLIALLLQYDFVGAAEIFR